MRRPQGVQQEHLPDFCQNAPSQLQSVQVSDLPSEALWLEQSKIYHAWIVVDSSATPLAVRSDRSGRLGQPL